MMMTETYVSLEVACCVLGMHCREAGAICRWVKMKMNCGMITVAVRYQINTLYVFIGSEIPNRKTERNAKCYQYC